MFGKEEPAAMIVIDFQHEGRSLVRCSFGAGSGDQLFLWERNRAQDTTAPRERPYKQPGWGAESGQREGVHNVHTLGFGSGRTSAGLGRIADVFGGVADIQGLEPGSSPTSGTVFPQVRGSFCVFSCAHCAHSRR